MSAPKDVKSFEVRADVSRKDRNVPAEPLAQGWKEYDKKFNEHVQKWTMAELTEEKLRHEIITLATELRKQSRGVWSSEVKRRVPELLAGIFALYAILQSGQAYASASCRPDAEETEAMESESPEALEPQDRRVKLKSASRVLSPEYSFGCLL